MPAMDQLFTPIESYDKMNIEYLQLSKVMRHITALDIEKVAKDDEFKFREQAEVLVDKWHQILEPSSATKSTTNGGGDPAAGKAKPVNGDAGTKDVFMTDILAVNGSTVYS